MSHELTAYLSDFDLLLNSRKWLYYRNYITENFELHNSLRPSFTYMQDPHSNFDKYESFLKANSPGILTKFMTPSYGWGSTASRLESL